MSDDIEKLEDEFEQDDYIIDLLKEFRNQRNELLIMVKELDDLKARINQLFPEQINNRNKFYLEDKIKAATELFKAVLDIRKEVTRSIKDEIEIRRRMDKADEFSEEELENMMDMSAMAKKLEEIQKKKQKRTVEMDKKLLEVEQETKAEEGIE